MNNYQSEICEVGWKIFYKILLERKVYIPVVSFAWTVEALLNRNKTETRRCWSDKYVNTFKKQIDKSGLLFYGLNKALYRGGERIAICMVKNLFKQDLDLMTLQSLIAEGNMWEDVAEFRKKHFEGRCQVPFVLQFEVLEILKPQE